MRKFYVYGRLRGWPKRPAFYASFMAALALGGCLPGADGDDGALKATLGRFAGGDGPSVNRDGKKDALLTMRAAAAEDDASWEVTSVRRGGEQLVARGRGMVTGSIGPTLSDAPPVPIDAALAHFYDALRKLEIRHSSKPVTVVHLGDDHIAGDRFSGDLREQFQSRFGRAARGMLAPGLFPARGVKFDRGGHWKAFSSAEDAGVFGLTGVKLAASSPDAWMRLTAVDEPFEWVEITLETGPRFGAAVILIDGEAKAVSTASSSSDWKKIRLAKPGRELTIRAKGDGEIRVHSWTLGDSRPGVNYVNLGLPKATGLTAQRWLAPLMAADLKALEPSLIVLGYGSVEGFDDTLNTPAYEQRLFEVVTRLKTAAPQASLLIIGPPDSSRMPAFAAAQGGGTNACRGLTAAETARYIRFMQKEDMRLARWHAPPKLAEVRDVMRRVAAHTNAYFWDWSKIMGGVCGIHAWVHAEPPLAAADHVQLTSEGAKRSARSLFNELMGGYAAYASAARPIAAQQVTPVNASAAPRPKR
jgi:hypothetical protein